MKGMDHHTLSTDVHWQLSGVGLKKSWLILVCDELFRGGEKAQNSLPWMVEQSGKTAIT
jgi:hypothetical protein